MEVKGKVDGMAKVVECLPSKPQFKPQYCTTPQKIRGQRTYKQVRADRFGKWSLE
jgi:hypothetical protein